jgi:hypothetical protein
MIDAEGALGYPGAKLLFEKACNGGYGRGCTHEGIILEEEQEKQGLAKLQEACNLKDGWACYILGRFYAGRKEKADQVAANKLFSQACRYHFQSPGCSKGGGKNTKVNDYSVSP